MQEGIALHADVDEGGLEVVLEVLDAALEDGADETLFGGVFHLIFLEAAVFQHGDAGLEFFGVDDDFPGKMTFRPGNPFEFEKVFSEHG